MLVFNFRRMCENQIENFTLISTRTILCCGESQTQERFMAKIAIPGYRTISAAQMRVGDTYRIWRHKLPCEPSNATFVRLVSRPDCPIRDMGTHDAFVARILDADGNDTDDVIRIVRNGGAPFYPITYMEGKEPGKMVKSRLSVLVKEG